MSAKSICDGCGAESPMSSNGSAWFKPQSWYERGCGTADDQVQTACSRECIDTIAKRTGKTSVVLPI